MTPIEDLLHNAQLAQLSYCYCYACVLLLAVFLRSPWSQHRAVRTAVGLVITAVLLVGQPFIYDTPTQSYGIELASMCCLCAWTLLHWTFMEPLQQRPSILQVCMSTVTHPMAGVIKVYKRTQRHRISTDGSTATSPRKRHSPRPVVMVDAVGSAQEAHSTPATVALRQQLLAKLTRAIFRLLWVCLSYDTGMYRLCSFSNGMCGTTHWPVSHLAGPGFVTLGKLAATKSILLQQANRIVQSRFLSVCIFGYVAGALLPLQMDIMYCSLRSALLLGAMVWPDLRDLAEQLPNQAFNLPVASRNIRELWGFRWHGFLRFYFEGLGYSAVDRLLPKGKAVTPGLRSSMHTVAAFFMSGIMHEYLTWAAFGTVTGWYMAFFGLHCAAVLLESWGPLLLKAVLQLGSSPLRARASGTSYNRVSQDATDTVSTDTAKGAQSISHAQKKAAHILPAWLMRVWTISVMFLLSPLFVEPYRAAGYFAERAFHPFGVSVTSRVVNWAQQQLRV